MRVTFDLKRMMFVVLASALLASGCGSTDGRAPARLVINALNASAGSGTGGGGGAVLDSDVLPLVADFGQVTLSLVMRDQSGQTSPSSLNSVTVTRYRVQYRRTDGRNVPGVDVPYPFDSAFTVTVPVNGTADGGFQLVRITAKDEAPLRALARSGEAIHALADVTFYGQDLSGNDVSVTGTIGITFADFANTTN
jgi:hypothetical protein